MSSVWWSYGLAALSIYVTWLIGEKKTWGWLVGVAQQILWVGYAVATAQHGFVGSSLVFLVINARSYARWRRDDREREEQRESADRAV